MMKTSLVAPHHYKVRYNPNPNPHTDTTHTRAQVLFHQKTEIQKHHGQFFKKIKDKKLKRTYCLMDIIDASPSSVAILQRMAPPPPSATPFLLPRRFTVFFTVCPPDDCFLVVPHVDQHGSGPLVYGPSETGAFTSVAVCAPDYSKKKEAIPPEIKLVFSSNTNTVPVTPMEPHKKIHVVNLNVSGAQINLPAGCWHAVRSYGSSIRVSYYFCQRNL